MTRLVSSGKLTSLLEAKEALLKDLEDTLEVRIRPFTSTATLSSYVLNSWAELNGRILFAAKEFGGVAR